MAVEGQRMCHHQYNSVSCWWSIKIYMLVKPCWATIYHCMARRHNPPGTFLKRSFISAKSIGSKKSKFSSDLVSHSTSFLVLGYITQFDAGWLMVYLLCSDTCGCKGVRYSMALINHKRRVMLCIFIVCLLQRELICNEMLCVVWLARPPPVPEFPLLDRRRDVLMVLSTLLGPLALASSCCKIRKLCCSLVVRTSRYLLHIPLLCFWCTPSVPVQFYSFILFFFVVYS